MKVRVGRLYNSYRTLGALTEHKLPIALACKLTKLIRLIDTEVQAVERTRNELVAGHGTQDESGAYVVDEDKKEVFFEALKAVLNTVIDLEWTPISVESLGEIPLTVKELGSIAYLFTEFQETEEDLDIVAPKKVPVKRSGKKQSTRRKLSPKK